MNNNTQINDGGPAFRMTLRDYFAIRATEKDIKEHLSRYDKNGKYIGLRTQAQARYAFADAMIEAKGEKP